MTYRKALNWICGLEGHGIKLGLSNIRKLLKFYDNPHASYPVILIAGTNGKGSVASFIAHILQESGLKVGLYTSPHLITLRERINILQNNGNEYIPKAAVARIASKLKKDIEKIFDIPPYSKPTYFEVLTALSFLYFKEEKVDMAVCEVGMGGRLDATNVAEPILSVITGISFEHTNYLGKTLSSIAREKGGIIRENTPLVTGATGEALDAIRELAKEKNAPIFTWGEDFSVKNSKEEDSYQILDIQGIKDFYPKILIHLKGKWQHINTSLAIVASEILSDKFPIKKEHIYKGFKNTNWHGRLETIGKNPAFILDGAHNPQAARMLKEEIKKFKKDKKITMLFGVLKDKDRTTIMQELFPLANKIVLLEPNTERAVPLEILEKEGQIYNKNIKTSRNLASTIKKLKKATSNNDIIFICGSLYLVGEARSILLDKKQDA
jgi:dihydrofolate synthase/folylpolyglutamate synthase